MKYAADGPYANPKAVARRLVEIVARIEPVQDGRIYSELVNAPFLYKLGGSGDEFSEFQSAWRADEVLWRADLAVGSGNQALRDCWRERLDT